MPTIIALNPRKKTKRKPAAKKQKPTKKSPLKAKAKTKTKKYKAVKPAPKNTKGSAMAKKKRKIKKRRNPASSRQRGPIANALQSSVRTLVPMFLGAMAAKAAARKFTEGGAEADNWTWKNYLWAAGAGALVAGTWYTATRKRASAQRIFEGALFLIGYKLITNELASKSPSLNAWFGADDDTGFDPYAGVNYYGDVGDIWTGDQADYVQGIDGAWRPVDESHRLPQPENYGDVLVPASSRYGGFGDILVEPNARFGNIEAEMEKDGM